MASFTKIGKRGEIELPDEAREKARSTEGDSLSVETKADGSIVLRPAPPVRGYTDEDIEMFARASEVPPELAARVRAFLEKRGGIMGRVG